MYKRQDLYDEKSRDEIREYFYENGVNVTYKRKRRDGTIKEETLSLIHILVIICFGAVDLPIKKALITSADVMIRYVILCFMVVSSLIYYVLPCIIILQRRLLLWIKLKQAN